MSNNKEKDDTTLQQPRSTACIAHHSIEHDFPRTTQAAQALWYYNQLPSTNDTAQQLIASGAFDNALSCLHCCALRNAHEVETAYTPWVAVVGTHEQTQGRGRNGHIWVSERGTCSTISYVMRAPRHIIQDPARAGWLQIMAGLACRDALYEAAAELGLQWKEPVTLKWPNDIYIDGYKLGGILAQLVVDDPHDPWLIIGIGMNIAVNKQALPTDLATSCHMHLQYAEHTSADPHKLSKVATTTHVVDDMVDHLATRLTADLTYIDTLTAATVRALRSRMSALQVTPDRAIAHMHQHIDDEHISWQLGKHVHITYANGRTAEGTAIGIASDASLIVDCEGERIYVHTGDVGVFAHS